MGKVTLITGATSGMGKEMALFLAGRGYDVYAGARNPADGDALVAEAKGRGIHLKSVQLDVTEDGSVRAAVSRVARESGWLLQRAQWMMPASRRSPLCHWRPLSG